MLATVRTDDDMMGLLPEVLCCSGSEPTREPRLPKDRAYWPLSDEPLYSVMFVCDLEQAIRLQDAQQLALCPTDTCQ